MTTLAEIKTDLETGRDTSAAMQWWLVERVEKLEGDVQALRSALLEQAQLAEEAGLVLRGVYRTARGIARDKSLDGLTPPGVSGGRDRR